MRCGTLLVAAELSVALPNGAAVLAVGMPNFGAIVATAIAADDTRSEGSAAASLFRRANSACTMSNFSGSMIGW